MGLAFIDRGAILVPLFCMLDKRFAAGFFIDYLSSEPTPEEFEPKEDSLSDSLG